MSQDRSGTRTRVGRSMARARRKVDGPHARRRGVARDKAAGGGGRCAVFPDRDGVWFRYVFSLCALCSVASRLVPDNPGRFAFYFTGQSRSRTDYFTSRTTFCTPFATTAPVCSRHIAKR